MYGFNPPFDTYNQDDDNTLTSYNLLFLLTGLALVIYMLARFAEANNQLNYENRTARIIAGTLLFMMRLLHTKNDDLEITNDEEKLVAVGPHRTGWEAIAVASKMRGAPPHFFATDAYNTVPGVSSFMNMFQVIPVKAKASRTDIGRTANADALDQASQVLQEHGCVALFPQGNFARLGQEPPRVYSGAAKLALQNKIPIHVVRLDGFWSLQNPIIPLFIRNNSYYRAFLSGLHMNNIQATLCCIIDFHLKPEQTHLSDDEKIEEICAQLYAYYRHTQELTPKQIDGIKKEISDKTHLSIWKNKVKRDELGKELSTLKKEQIQLEEPTSALMRLEPQ